MATGVPQVRRRKHAEDCRDSYGWQEEALLGRILRGDPPSGWKSPCGSRKLYTL